MARSLLAVFAHPDDETFLMGGTLALLRARGWRVSVLTATDGEAGRRGPYVGDDLSSEAFGALRRRELESACEELGVDVLPGARCPDGGVEGCGDEFRELLRTWLARIRPDVVVTFGPDGVSGHADHVAVGRLTSEALEARRVEGSAGGRGPELLYVLGSEALPECCRRGGAAPEPPETLRVDISPVADRKIAAIAAYRSQEHLQPGDSAELDAIRTTPERFHRVTASSGTRSGKRVAAARRA